MNPVAKLVYCAIALAVSTVAHADCADDLAPLQRGAPVTQANRDPSAPEGAANQQGSKLAYMATDIEDSAAALSSLGMLQAQIDMREHTKSSTAIVRARLALESGDEKACLAALRGDAP